MSAVFAALFVLFASDWSDLGDAAVQRLHSARLVVVSGIAGLASLAYADLARRAADLGHPGAASVTAAVAVVGMTLIAFAWRVRMSDAGNRVKLAVCVVLGLWTVGAVLWLVEYVAAAAILG